MRSTVSQQYALERTLNLLAEISMYPLRNDYIAPIDDFIAALNQDPDIEVTTNRMSTQVYGAYDAVMNAVSAAMRRSNEQYGTVCFTCKFIPGAERSINGYQ
ncbi:MAG: YkoF family thiamine/hydroxymethylpyrimidine-binding protein [Pseudomonadales bacterium]